MTHSFLFVACVFGFVAIVCLMLFPYVEELQKSKHKYLIESAENYVKYVDVIYTLRKFLCTKIMEKSIAIDHDVKNDLTTTTILQMQVLTLEQVLVELNRIDAKYKELKK